ncbi:hypothetical protein K8I31_11350 [bacterium]|nr:hypothetical protein [bacterium]
MMDQVQRIFFLKQVPGFESLRDHEIEVIADVLSERTYESSSIVAAAGSTLSSLLITVSGGLIMPDGTKLPCVTGAPSLLFDWELSNDIHSVEEEQTVCLTLSKGRFFTLAYECPMFLFALLGKTEPKGMYTIDC